jgi:preprotein translocase subunit SecD
MRNPWMARILIILIVLCWGGYTITPTLLQESVEDRLTAQADAANNGVEEDEDRIPEAAHLPIDIKKYVLQNTRDCRTSCKKFANNESGHEWVGTYFNVKGKSALERCAQRQVPGNEKDACGITGLKSCVVACTGSSRSEEECASACLSINNESMDAPEWGAEFYASSVNTAYNQCIGEKAQQYITEENCKNQQISACVSDCQDNDEEVLNPMSALMINIYPKSKLSLGLDLQGGIDMDLEVEIEEAVISSVQRDINSVRDSLEGAGHKIDEVRRDIGEPTLLIALKEGTTLNDIKGIMSNRFTRYKYTSQKEEYGKVYYAFQFSDEAAKDVSEKAIQQALETLRSRIDETGVKEPSIVLKGGSRINVQLPGIKDVEQAMSAIGTAAVLEFMLVDEETMKNPRDLERALLDAEKVLDSKVYLDDVLLSNHLLRQEIIPLGRKLMWEYINLAEGGKERSQYYVVTDNVILTGDDINDAQVAIDQFNQPYTSMEFKPLGASIFSQVTEENVSRRFAIVLDKEVKSAPYIREKIAGGRASIDMGSNDYQQALQEASVLSLVLRTGALPAPVTIGKVRMVGASLGKDAVDSGKKATFIGFGLVLFFMLIYYGKAGVVSVIALLANVVLVFAFLCTAGATLTLPGITGIALTIGMAVDCNIIIYERISEELKLGKNAKSAVKTGFDKALLAVLDANITTFIAGVVLYTYGTGPIKGFAVTLMIGIITTLFTGVFVSRTLMDFVTRKPNATLNL